MTDDNTAEGFAAKRAKTKARKLTAERVRDLLDYDPVSRTFTYRAAHGRARAGDVAADRIILNGKTYSAARIALLYLSGTMPPVSAGRAEIEAALTGATARALDTTTLTAERMRCLLHYDQTRGYFTWRVGRRGTPARTVAGAPNGSGYIAITIDRRRFLRAWLAFLYMRGRWATPQVDHRNGLVDDDRWSNLREASQGENSRNVRQFNKHGVPGVEYLGDNRSKPWRAQIWIAGKRKHLGIYASKAEATAAYEAQTVKHHGRFAVSRRPEVSDDYVSFADARRGAVLAEMALADGAGAQ